MVADCCPHLPQCSQPVARRSAVGGEEGSLQVVQSQRVEGWCHEGSGELYGVAGTYSRRVEAVGQPKLTSPGQCVSRVGGLVKWEGVHAWKLPELQWSIQAC